MTQSTHFSSCEETHYPPRGGAVLHRIMDKNSTKPMCRLINIYQKWIIEVIAAEGGHTRYWKQRSTYFCYLKICNIGSFSSINAWLSIIYLSHLFNCILSIYFEDFCESLMMFYPEKENSEGFSNSKFVRTCNNNGEIPNVHQTFTVFVFIGLICFEVVFILLTFFLCQMIYTEHCYRRIVRLQPAIVIFITKLY